MPAQDVLNKAVDAVNRHDADAYAALYDAASIAYDP